METSKLGEASFYENDLFSSPALEDSYSIAYNDTKPPIYDDYNEADRMRCELCSVMNFGFVKVVEE